MLPKYLKVKGFRSYIDTEINFESFGNTFVVLGENGAGKSSIIEMITTALYWVNSCTDSKGAGMDNCINSDCDHFEIEFCFVMNGITYIIKTIKYRNEARELEFYIDGVNQSEKVTETQQKINDVLKMNYDTFLDTVCIGQGKSSRFMSKKPAERKETLMQILDVQKYEKYERIAKEKKKEIKNQIDDFEKKIEFISSTEDGRTEKELLEEIKEYQNQIDIISNNNKILNIELDKIKKEKLEYFTKKQQYDNIEKNYVLTKRNYDTLKNKLEDLDIQIKNNKYENVNFDDKIDNLRNQLNDKREEISKLKDAISDEKSKIAVLQSKNDDILEQYNRLKNYDKSICELCGNEITFAHKKEHLHKLKNIYDDNDKKIELINSNIHKYNQNGKEIASQGKELNSDLKMIQQKQKMNLQYKSELDYLNKSKNDIKEQIVSSKEQFEMANKMYLSIEHLEEKSFNDEEIEEKINNNNNLISDYNAKISYDKTIIENKKKNKDTIKKYKEQIKQLKLVHTDYGSLATAFGKTGIPASIIAHDIPEMEIETNKILKILSNDTMSIQFITSKKTATTKKTVDTLEIVVNDMNGSRSYETYSGGEKFRIDFACHIGMAKFLTKRAGASIDFLIVDEGLGSQDDFAKQKFIESIHSLQGLFKQIMVITHIQDLQNAFDNRVLIEKTPINGSTVQLLN